MKATKTEYVRHGNRLFLPRQAYNGLQWEPALEAVAADNRQMPSPSIFMSYLLHVRDTQKGSSLYNYLFTPATDNEGICTWLNARFVQGSGYKSLDVESRFQQKEGKNTIITIKRSPLEKCLDIDCFADLDSLNEQGLPTKKSRSQEYQPGKNVYFWPPFVDRVSGFRAYSGRVGLDCCGDPRGSGPGLGVLAYAEGAQKNKK